MRKDTVLVHVPCDVKRLPLNAFEGYLLSLVDGRLTLDELAEIAGSTVTQISRHAEHLVEVGAVAVVGEARPARRESGQTAAVKRSSRAPAVPRVIQVPTSRRSRRPSAPASAHPASSRAKPTRASSSRSMTARPSAARSVRPSPEETGTALDDAARVRILELDARLGALDHYELLGVARDAEKGAIKRAYFALAAEFHPDRYFGKKLGSAKAPLERVFVRLTEAHDTLTIRARRAAYDEALPPPPPPSPSPSPSPPPPSKRSTPRRSTKKMKAVESRRSPRPPPPVVTIPPGPASVPRPPVVVSTLPEAGSSARPPVILSPVPPPGRSPGPPPSSDEGLRRLYWSRKQNEIQRRVGVFVEAAETALLRDDVVTAVENYRLALQINDDVELRQKIKAIEWRAKGRIHETGVARGRAAEAAGRWEEAATQYAQANGAKPEAWTAERAAHAIRMHGGDTRRAIQFAEQAVLAEPQNVAYHLTLGEACLAANLFARAAGEASRALAVTPNDERAKALAAAAKRR